MIRSQTSSSASIEASISVLQGLTGSSRRQDLWCDLITTTGARTVLELGVWQGAFAETVLRRCQDVSRYFMLDPWKHLDDWNKPANVDQVRFDENMALALARTDFARDRRMVLRGTTVDVIDEIADGSIDVAYIDGDHTLRGITIDLIRTYPKVRAGAIIGGDDYTRTIWQHGDNFEPTLVCPFAAYFAESQGAPLVILPHNQFAIVKPLEPGLYFRVIDLTDGYGSRSLLPQILRRT